MLRTMLDAGVELALGSDAPVARLDPRPAGGEQPPKMGVHKICFHFLMFKK